MFFWLIVFDSVRIFIIMQCPTHIKKLEKIVEQGEYECELCGRKASLECKSCEFKQCS